MGMSRMFPANDAMLSCIGLSGVRIPGQPNVYCDFMVLHTKAIQLMEELDIEFAAKGISLEHKYDKNLKGGTTAPCSKEEIKNAQAYVKEFARRESGL